MTVFDLSASSWLPLPPLYPLPPPLPLPPSLPLYPSPPKNPHPPQLSRGLQSSPGTLFFSGLHTEPHPKGEFANGGGGKLGLDYIKVEGAGGTFFWGWDDGTNGVCWEMGFCELYEDVCLVVVVVCVGLDRLVYSNSS